jgi:type IV pilus biogenesis protein CpaD/CtpE
MRALSTVLLTAAIALTVACGYSKKATNPAVAGTMPTITELAPANVNSGEPAFLLTINGSNFSGKATINWNGVAQSTTDVSASQLTAIIPASAISTAATVMVTVSNPATAGTAAYGGGGTLAETSNAMSFTIN